MGIIFSETNIVTSDYRSEFHPEPCAFLSATQKSNQKKSPRWKAEASSSGTQPSVHNQPGLSPHQSWTSSHWLAKCRSMSKSLFPFYKEKALSDCIWVNNHESEIPSARRVMHVFLKLGFPGRRAMRGFTPSPELLFCQPHKKVTKKSHHD